MSSIEMLSSLKLKRWKIPSGEITNYPYLLQIGSRKQSVILSTGMANLGEIESALSVLEQGGTSRSQITVLHCTTEYPAPVDEVNLRAMNTIAKAFGVAVGYSDHTEGILVPIAAVAMGATIIEKHLPLTATYPDLTTRPVLNLISSLSWLPVYEPLTRLLVMASSDQHQASRSTCHLFASHLWLLVEFVLVKYLVRRILQLSVQALESHR